MERRPRRTSKQQPAGSSPRVIPYPAIEKHGIIGDRRTAALVATDGTLDWLCLPDYDSPLIFGALLDVFSGGFWRFGPDALMQGEQHYIENTVVLETRWSLDAGDLLLTDAMLWPETKRRSGRENTRVVLRRLCCERGEVKCAMQLQPARDFSKKRFKFSKTKFGFRARVPGSEFRIWTNFSLRNESSGLSATMDLAEGDEFWMVLQVGGEAIEWSTKTVGRELQATQSYWRDWLSRLSFEARKQEQIRRTALSVHLLNYAPSGSVVAAPTSSLPERIGGTWNSDYRFSWIRDTSLALGLLARLGDWKEIERYLEWLVRRRSPSGPPLQVLYEVGGGKQPAPREVPNASGYRGSQPVRFGNHAYKQHQLGSFGFLADCVWLYLQEGGRWQDDYWNLIRRCADFIVENWSKPDNGIWELSVRQHYVHSKVLCWVTLDRATRIARKVQTSFETRPWESTRDQIHRDVMDKGWSKKLSSFRQRYEGENLDAAELLIPIMDFLPGDHPRVLSTLDRIAEKLCIDGFVYRFDPAQTPGVDPLPMGEMEGAFLPCTFWLATGYAKAGRIEKARSILHRVERVTGKTSLLPEAIDPRTGNYLGNTPLLFSHVEYVRAKLELGS